MPKSCESGGDDLLKWWERAVCCLDAFGWDGRRGEWPDSGAATSAPAKLGGGNSKKRWMPGSKSVPGLFFLPRLDVRGGGGSKEKRYH